MTANPIELLDERLLYHKTEYERVRKKYVWRLKEYPSWTHICFWEEDRMIDNFMMIIEYKEAIEKLDS